LENNFKKYLAGDEPSVYHRLTSANQINEPYNVAEQSQLVNQTPAKASREKSENIYSIKKRTSVKCCMNRIHGKATLFT